MVVLDQLQVLFPHLQLEAAMVGEADHHNKVIQAEMVDLAAELAPVNLVEQEIVHLHLPHKEIMEE
jgi:hypothetical protein